MTDLTQDEFTVLLIAAKGESMIPIGRWEAPVRSLVEKGMLHSHNLHNNTITPAGRVAIEKHGLEEDEDFKRVLTRAYRAQVAHSSLQERVKRLVDDIVQLARESHAITGIPAELEAKRWLAAIQTEVAKQLE